MDVRLQWLAFHRVCWTQPQRAWNLLLRCGSLAHLLYASQADLPSLVEGDWQIIEQLRSKLNWAHATRDLEYMTTHHIQMLLRGHEGYPILLEEINDPPILLFWRGNDRISLNHSTVSVVGTRKPTPYGLQMTEEIVSVLAARGHVIVSGLAFGIDACAHHAALDAGGTTIAILASGVDDITPHRHYKLGHWIVNQGALCSEVPLGMPAHASHFLWRNRIISGFSYSTLIVECCQKSGTMVTATHAADQGRDVFAVPGPLSSAMSAGPNYLLEQGAYRCLSADDILNPKAVEIQEDKKYGHSKALDDTTTRLLKLISTEPRSSNQLAEALQIPITQILQSVTMLECEGLIQVLPNGLLLCPTHSSSSNHQPKPPPSKNI